MLYWSMVFLVLAVIFGALGIAGVTVTVPVPLGWIMFTLCLAIFLMFLLAGCGSKLETGECAQHPVPGKPCQKPGPHDQARGATGCIWCGRPM